MSWRTLVDAISVFRTFSTPVEDARTMLELLASDDPELYWYPGSGSDLMPLALDTPRNQTGKRLFPLMGDRQDRKLIVWMNDYDDALWSGPGRFHAHVAEEVENDEFRMHIAAPQLLGRFAIHTQTDWQGLPAVIPIALFQVQVTGGTGRYRRCQEGDLYTVVFSNVESQILLEGVFVPHRLQLRVVALQRQGGFSGQRGYSEPGCAFSQYVDIPAHLGQHEDQIGRVEAYLVDHDTSINGYHAHGDRLPYWGIRGTKMLVPDEA